MDIRSYFHPRNRSSHAESLADGILGAMLAKKANAEIETEHRFYGEFFLRNTHNPEIYTFTIFGYDSDGKYGCRTTAITRHMMTILFSRLFDEVETAVKAMGGKNGNGPVAEDGTGEDSPVADNGQV